MPGLSDFSDHLAERIGSLRARVRYGYPWWLRPFLDRNVVAITLGRRVYLSPRLIERAEEDLEKLLRHELAHVEQVIRHGLLIFLFLYVREYIALRRSGLPAEEAYRKISFEAEALAAEEAV
jgi:hypothetical protein